MSYFILLVLLRGRLGRASWTVHEAASKEPLQEAPWSHARMQTAEVASLLDVNVVTVHAYCDFVDPPSGTLLRWTWGTMAAGN